MQTWTSEDVRDAVAALYRGEVSAQQVEQHFHGAPRRRVAEPMKRLPPGLADDQQTRSLRRACNELAGVKENEVYTHSELRTALFCCETTDSNKKKLLMGDLRAAVSAALQKTPRATQESAAEAGEAAAAE